MTRLAVAYGRHQVRRRIRRHSPQLQALLESYAADRLRPLTRHERERLGAMSRCINCGLCALVAGRNGLVSAQDLSSTYLRALHLLPIASADVAPAPADLEAAAAACPVGVPLPEVALMAQRFAENMHS